jgi:hypothetical protein
MFSSYLVSRTLIKNAVVYCKQTIPRNAIINRTFTSTVQKQNGSLALRKIVRKTSFLLGFHLFKYFSEHFRHHSKSFSSSTGNHKILLKSGRACSETWNQSCRMVACRLFWDGVRGCYLRWDSRLRSPLRSRHYCDIRNPDPNHPIS